MLEKALTGTKGYKAWVFVLLVILGIGFLNYLRQWNYGLGITGMSRSVSAMSKSGDLLTTMEKSW